MIELFNSPSTRSLSRGRLALWLVVSLVFAALLFAAGAQAQGTSAPEGATETPVGEGATTPPATEEHPSTTEQAPPAAEATPLPAQAPPAAEQAPPPVEPAPPPPAEATPPPVEQAPPPAEQAPPAAEPPPPAEQAPPPAEPQPPPPVEQAPPTQAPPVVEAPPTKQAPPAVEEAPPPEKKAAAQTGGEVVATEAGSGGHATQGTGEGSQAGEVAPEGSATPSAISPPPVRDQSSLTWWPQTISAGRAGQTSCELAAIEASTTAGYAGGWLDISAASPVSAIPLATAGSSPAAITTGAPAGSQDGRSAVEDHPSAPTPGPGPGGAGSGSAAGSGSGSASSASFTLVGVLFQATPSAMRRLRLAQPSWRTSFFVLIPERPD